MKKTKIELKELLRQKEMNIEILLEKIGEYQIRLDNLQGTAETLREVEFNLAQAEGKVKKLTEENESLRKELEDFKNALLMSENSNEVLERAASTFQKELKDSFGVDVKDVHVSDESDKVEHKNTVGLSVLPTDLVKNKEFPSVFKEGDFYRVTFDTNVLNRARLEKTYTFTKDSEIVLFISFLCFNNLSNAIYFHLCPKTWQTCPYFDYDGFIVAFDDGPSMGGSSYQYIVPVDAIKHVYECEISEEEC